MTVVEKAREKLESKRETRKQERNKLASKRETN